jgi:hypothetical protein
MVRKDSGFLKHMRIQEIKREIGKVISQGVPYESLLDWIEVQIGLRRETAKSYVDLIMRTEGWLLIDGKIVAEIPET